MYHKQNKTNAVVNPMEELKALFDSAGIAWADGQNLVDPLQNISDQQAKIQDFFSRLLYLFRYVLQMSNSIENSEINYIISPVKTPDGTFFDSRKQKALGDKAKLPIDADANGAYNIALKALYLLLNDFNRDKKTLHRRNGKRRRLERRACRLVSVRAGKTVCTQNLRTW